MARDWVDRDSMLPFEVVKTGRDTVMLLPILLGSVFPKVDGTGWCQVYEERVVAEFSNDDIVWKR